MLPPLLQVTPSQHLTMTCTGRKTNILETVPADPAVKPTAWPQYVTGPKALPEASREWSCYPTSEDQGLEVLKKDGRKTRE